MRQIGSLPSETHARLFGDLLLVKGITNQVEAESADSWIIWVHDEDRLAQATELLEDFRRNPMAPEFKRLAKKAVQRRTEAQREQKAYAKRYHDRSQLALRVAPYGAGLLTLVLIGICGYFAVRTSLGANREAVHGLMISNPMLNPLVGYLYEVRQGEVWRVITPIFLHFGPLHLIGNLLWLFQLGSMIEDRKGSGLLLLQVIVIGVLSNLAQYFASGPSFGGMSGVVYGLFGFIWIRGKFDPGSGLLVDRDTIILMMLWFVLCMTSLVGPIANIAHAAGLLAGMAWGFLSAQLAG